ncbi:DUF4982 domain-containing protein [Fulvivirga sp. M361]|uniref:glycoside hydrolase family 2 protein n=1 Tax=Fulvivirga sp. M361 TaxID=2594266 RepID=UPI00117A4ABD|nr:glycoside hydrolase family 2 TIM barrel-domain containing protein [Fulvivirga sp. M361]TRX60195.1 DUF4982 domain-containing protein [Fulvivirga sp. M361]
MYRQLLIFILILHGAVSMALEREQTNLNDNWQYLEKAYLSCHEANLDPMWTMVSLPHSWNNEDVVDMIPGYRRDASWYKKMLKFKEVKKNKRYLIYFEGVNITSEVYVNNQLVTKHIGGYLGFEADISDHLVDGMNTLMVRVDNGYNRQVIPSQKSDFFIYGGITRDVWLREVSETYLSDLKISTPQVSQTKAKVDLKLTIKGNIDADKSVQVSIKDPSGKVVFRQSSKVGNSMELSFELANPELWEIDDPNLYKVEIELLKKGKAMDFITETYGYRWFEFKDHGPFYLNGERLLLRGTHRHEEHAGVGAAMSNQLHRKDIEMIKEMGANFVRLGHYPQDPEVYKACDELGILVWDELPWCRGGVGDDTWKTNTKHMLKEMILQNYNHPSVIIWSLGNEIYWLPDFENGDNRENMNTFLRELNDLAHELDAGRKTAIRKYYEGADIVDVFSPSIWSGWYSGSYKNYENAIRKSHAKYPHFIHMEYGGSSMVGRHTEQPITGDGIINADEWEEPINQVAVQNIAKNGDWSENYIVDLFDWHLMVSETQDQFIGNAQWAFKDFGTPLRPENDIPYMNQKGLTDRAGNPKDAYYVFKSYWSDDPFIYIESHTWTDRSGPKGKSRNLSVFSNLKQVELFHNSVSLGKKTKDITKFPACGLNWDIDFEKGENEFRAVGYDQEGEKIEDTILVTYSYEKSTAPEEILLSYELQKNGNYLVTATMVDNVGRRCLDYEERVYFQCMSGGELHRNQGTPTGTEAIRMSNGKASIEVIPNDYSGGLKMSVLNQDFKGSFLVIENQVGKRLE